MRFLRKLVPILFLITLVAGFAFSQKASALSGSDFAAGRIIDDSVFFNSYSMSPQEIQDFLNSKVPVCDTWGTQPYGNGMTRAEYSATKGYYPPFTCLKDYAQDIPAKAPDAYCIGSISGGVKTSAQIIYDVSRACGVNPKVLIVLLQKEQSLVTDDWPWSIQYRSATGYGCPDTSACDSTYYGFFNQVYNAARQYQRYSIQPQLFNYRGGQTGYVQFNPNAGCGGTNVYMENQSTAGLYNYTPYQPNQAALANLYGTGDGCSAYGNRNFWRLFNDWFGSTYGPSLAWQWAGQYAYTDATKTVPKSLNGMLPGDRVYIGFKAKNIGNVTWSNTGSNPVRVGTSWPQERNSIFHDGTWLSPSRPAVMQESSVAPGQTGTFEFWITVPDKPGGYNEHFNLVAEGVTWMNDIGLSFGIGIAPKVYSWQWAGQYAYTDATKTVPKSLNGMLPGDKAYVGFKAKNTGNQTWSNTGSNPVRVGTAAPIERTSAFSSGSSWLGSSRPAVMQESSVAPGQTGTFEFWITANSTGYYNERFNLVAEGLTWLNDIGLSYGIGVAPKVYSWQWAGQYAYTDDTKTTPVDLATLHPNDLVYVGFKAKNTGNQTWSNTGSNPVRVGTAAPLERSSVFAYNTWIGSSRPAVMQESSVAPGQTGTFEFWMKVPNTTGEYNERFNLVSEGLTWFNDIGLSYYIKSS